VRFLGWKVDLRIDTVLQGLRACAMRSFFHLSVLVLVVLALSLSRLEPVQFSVSVDVMSPTAAPTSLPRAVVSSHASVRGADRQDVMAPSHMVVPVAAALMQNLIQAPVPHTIIPERPRKSVITYTVQSGDNVFGIARRFGLMHETIVWANEELETDPDMLYIGQVLHILPLDGVYHTVQEGETLKEVAEKYKVSLETITECEYNGLGWGDDHIEPGQKLIVPGGSKPFKPHFIRFEPVLVPQDAIRGSGNFVWPVGGYVSQEHWNLHRALDIAGTYGEVVVATDAGVVVYASWERTGYGNLVVIDHGNGFISYYAHLYGFYVDAGQTVGQGQPIGARGNTGRSTGAHLHFEIRHNDVHRNPLELLPKE
jgi:murein DD-endopeptidase MepM/ murein hydrolase activator NlpD